jgi:hypothetical protein
MLDQHESHAGIGWCVSQETLEGGKPARGRTDSNYEGCRLRHFLPRIEFVV